MDHTIFFFIGHTGGGGGGRVYNDFSYLLQFKIYEKKELNKQFLIFEYI